MERSPSDYQRNHLNTCPAITTSAKAHLTLSSRGGQRVSVHATVPLYLVLISGRYGKRLERQGHWGCRNRVRRRQSGRRSVWSPRCCPGNRLHRLLPIRGSFVALCCIVTSDKLISRKPPPSGTRSKSSVSASLRCRRFSRSPLAMRPRKHAGKNY